MKGKPKQGNERKRSVLRDVGQFIQKQHRKVKRPGVSNLKPGREEDQRIRNHGMKSCKKRTPKASKGLAGPQLNSRKKRTAPSPGERGKPCAGTKKIAERSHNPKGKGPLREGGQRNRGPPDGS